MSLHFRTATLEPGTGRTIFGLAVPFGQAVDINEFGHSYQESFERGAFRKTIVERGSKVKLFDTHNTRKLPVGKATELVEKTDGLHVAFEIAATRDGDDALELVRSGVVDAFSVGFRPLRERQDGDVTVRTEVALMEVSLVGLPAYEGATIVGVRSNQFVIPKAAAERRLRLLDL
jgi:HK97 family phage prohead protease